MLLPFFVILKHYLREIIPALVFGFFLSGLINEFIPTAWVERHLGKKGVSSIFYATITGTVLPICCWGALPDSTILVLRREFGFKILLFYLVSISILSLFLGYIFSLL